MSAHCAAERRPQGTIRQRRIFGIGDASPRCRRRLGCTSHAQARGGSLLHHVPNRPPRFPTSTPPPGPSAHPSGFSIRSQRDYFGFNPTAFKAPVRTSVATEFNPGEHEYDTIPARHPSIRARGRHELQMTPAARLRRAARAICNRFGGCATVVRAISRQCAATRRIADGTIPSVSCGQPGHPLHFTA